MSPLPPLSVANLKKAIEERCHIPVSEQILLISGGERLEDNQRVGKYHTGTDSNPIFLFRDVSNSPPTSVVDVNEYMPGKNVYNFIARFFFGLCFVQKGQSGNAERKIPRIAGS